MGSLRTCNRGYGCSHCSHRPASRTGPSAQRATGNRVDVFGCRLVGRSGARFKTRARARHPQGRPGFAFFGRGCAKDRAAPNGMPKRRSSKYPPLLRPPAPPHRCPLAHCHAAVPASIARPSAAATEQYSPSGYSDSGYSLKDVPNDNEAQNGVWAAVYGAYERHDNLSPGQDNNATRTQYTKGVVSGIDTYVSPTGGGYGAPQIQLGILGGYESTRSAFTTPSALAWRMTRSRSTGRRSTKEDLLAYTGRMFLISLPPTCL